MFLSLDHPAIACYDVMGMADWYCRHLGMRVIANNGKEPPAVMVGYDDDVVGGAMIELMPIRDARPGAVAAGAIRTRAKARGAGGVPTFDAAYAELKAAGVTFCSEPGEPIGGGRIVSFYDPEGNELQIVQR